MLFRSPRPSRLYPACHPRDRDYDDIDDDDPFNPQARRIATHNPPRGQLRSFCSYSSGLGSQGSLHPAQTISNAPVSEYMYGGAPGASPQHAGLGLWRFSWPWGSWICRRGHVWVQGAREGEEGI